MNEIEAIKAFIKSVATASKARRYVELVNSAKGQKKFLAELHHGLHSSLLDNLRTIKDKSKCNKLPCYIYSEQKGFGVPVTTFSEAYGELSSDDGWVIVSQDGSYGAYRPEDNWSDEVLIRI